ncbi:unnamed protein product [Prunus armeniaca]
MVNANFSRPDQSRQSLDLGGSAKTVVERRAREIPADPKAEGKAKMHLDVAQASEQKEPTKEKPAKASVLCSWCQYEVTLKVVSPKTKETTKEPSREPIKDEVQVGRPRSSGRNMITSSAENYNPHSPKGRMGVRLNKGPLHEYQDRHERPRYQPKRRNQHVPLRYEEIDPLNPSQDRSMWIPMGKGKNRDVAYVSRPHPADGNGVPTFKMSNTKADSSSKAAGSKFQARDAQRTKECWPAPCQKHPLDQHIFSLLFLHQIQPRKRKGKKKKQQTKSGSSHCTAAGKEDVEPPNPLNS